MKARYKERYQEWWVNLSLREKQSYSVGAVFVLILLLYFLIWSPFTNKIDSLRNEIRQNHAALIWMQASDQQIQTLEKLQNNKTQKHSTESLLGIIQNEVNHSAFTKNITQLQQAENNSVEIHFQRIDFDKLIAWLIELWQKEKVSVSRMTAVPSTTPGIVDVTLVISK